MAGRGLCLFGGTFNPPHASHHRVLTTACAHLQPARIVVMPCGDHPLKHDGALVPAEHRLAMCRLAFADVPDVEVSRAELDRAGPSYTIDTVRALRAAVGLDEPLWVLIGSDNLPHLHLWRDHASLFELATLVTFPRRGHPITARALQDVAIRQRHKELLLENALDGVPVDDLSSTSIRAALARGRVPPELHPDVVAYIRSHRLYGTGTAAS